LIQIILKKFAYLKFGEKIGMYYLRTRPKADAIQFTVDQTALAQTKKADLDKTAASEKSKDLSKPSSVVDKENAANASSSGAFSGLDYEAEVACESCSA
jgi:hypothetical protein